ncbi:MAG: hypothetical protein IJ106_10860 [Parasporobacterium sp.]|nr:hypothetical protein [Parasporobacterium sp.]
MQNSELILKLMLLMLLAMAAYEDYQTGTLSLMLLGTGAFAGTAVRILGMEPEVLNTAAGVLSGFLAGIAPGLVLLILGFASREAVGYGDGLLICVTGIFLGGSGNFLLLLFSLLLAAFGSVLLMILKIRRRTDRIVFAPFVLGGYLLLTGVCL